jgi:pimeloyl-ACP methyl ester carboxylesterase
LGILILKRYTTIKSLKLGANTVKYVDAGSGETMLFLHNGGSGYWVWHYQIQHFAKKYRVLAFDMLGCGASDRPNVPYDLKFYTDMVDQIIKKLDLQNVILVGNCVGSGAALEYALLHPGKLKALIVFNLCGGPEMMTPLVRLASLSMPNIFDPIHWAALKIFEHIPGVIDSAVRTNYAVNPDTNDYVFIEEIKAANNPSQTRSRINLKKGLASFNKFSHDFVVSEYLPPTKVFWGQNNKVLSAKNGLQFCERLQPEQFEIIEKAGHLAMAEKPDYVNSQIERFLTNLNTKRQKILD